MDRGVEFAGKWTSYLGDSDGGWRCILWMVVPSSTGQSPSRGRMDG